MKKLSKILSVALIMAMLITAVPLYSAAAENYLWPVPKGNNNYIYLESLPGINIKGGDKVFATKSGTVVYSYYGCGNSCALTTGVPCSSATCSPSASFYTNKDYNIRLCNWGYGNGFVLKHSDGSGYSFYGHMGANYVRTGDKVYRGQHVGMMGGSGLSFVENLYFAIGSDYKKSGTYYYAGSTYANGRNDIDYDYYPGASPVTIHSQGAKDITHNSITFYIDITVDTDYVRQLQLDVSNNYYDLENYGSVGKIRKTYTYTVNNLSPATDYSYRFLATVLESWGTTYADTDRFTVSTLATPPSSVSLNKASAKLYIGNTLQLSATVLPENAQQSVSWKSSDASVATVSSKGLVTAKKAGTATITATTVNGKTATCKITVKKKTVPATAVTLDKTSLKLYTGDKSTLKAKVTPSNTTDNLKWTSSNTKVATVENGVITAKSAGTAKITVKTDSGKTATCKVTVTKKVIPATAVKLDKTNVTLEKGDVAKLTAKVTPSNTTDKLTWKSSDTKVATVKDGVITAKSIGTTKITVKTSSGKTATCKVTVKKAQKKWTAANQYSFGNSYSEFITGRYTMSDADFERLSTYVRKQYSEETAKYYIDRLTASRENDRWGGSCYGMSVTALLDFDDRISMMENFDPDAASISAVDSPKHNAAVQSAINYYQLSQQIGFIGNNDGAFYNNGYSNWREGLISLVETAKKNEPILFCYWFSAGGHAIVIKSYKGTDADGNYVLVAYDNRYPARDITVLVDSAYSSLTVDGKKEVAYAFQFLTDFSVFDTIDIDGPNDDMVINSKKPGNINSAKPGTEVSVVVDGDITIWDDNDKYISIKNGVIKSTMDISSTRLIVHSAKDGKAAPAELIFSMNDSDSFTFKAEDKQISASVLSSDSFASVEANGADAATISETDGVSVSGNKAEYTVHKSVDESDFEMFCFSGVSGGVSSVNYSGGAVYVSGNKPGSINVGKFGGGDYEELSFNTTKENVEIKISDSPARKKGDVDGDGAVSAGDARLALRRSVGLESYTESSSEFKAADVDGNGQVLADDARKILRVSVGLEKF